VCEHKAHISAGVNVISRGRRRERGCLLWDTSRSDCAKAKSSELKEKKDFCEIVVKRVSAYTKIARLADKSSLLMQFTDQYLESNMDLDLCRDK
jgi:hypothetical protein